MDNFNAMNPMLMNMSRNVNNPAQMPTFNYTPPAPRYQVIRVNGEAGANAFRMAPNSSTFLLDNTAPIVWLAQTDGAGYLTVTPYDVTPHQASQPVDINNLAQRLTNLEEIVNANIKSYSGSTRQSKKRQQPAVESQDQSGSIAAD